MAQLEKTVELLRGERDRFVAFSFASADILVELDENGVILFVDGAISGLLGRKADDLLGNNFTTLVHNDDFTRTQNMLATELKEDRIDHEKVHLNSKFGDAIPFALSGYKLGALKNHYYLALTYLKADVKPDEINRRDKGTGLFKKESFVKTATQKIRTAQEDGKNVKLALVDLPELTELLDHMAQEEAHSLIHEISAYLRHTSLGGDTASMTDTGTYSLLIEAGIKTEQVMEQLFQITRKADPDGKGIHPRAETIATENVNLTEQDAANALLYTINHFARTHGENFRINSLSDGYQSMLQDTVKKISDFKNTVDSHKFQLAFQPIVDLKNGITHHHEVLVRFDGDSGFNDPFNFISFGEEAGVISEFDLAMCQRAIEVLHKAKKQGHKPVIAVNLSGKSLSSTLYMDTLREILAQNPTINKQLIFEITESAKITDFELANNFLQELRKDGFLCCLDDFGVGESSFSYLRSLHVDFVKIDGSYVRESIATKRGTHLLKAMSGMCRELGIVTIGEMVEDEKIARLLWESGVRFGQGYFFGKPTMDESALAECSQPNPYYHGVFRAKTFR